MTTTEQPQLSPSYLCGIEAGQAIEGQMRDNGSEFEDAHFAVMWDLRHDLGDRYQEVTSDQSFIEGIRTGIIARKAGE